jgi:hypothetical protein
MHSRLLGLACTILLLPIPARAQTPDHSQEAFIVEQVRTAWRFENDGRGQREMYMRLRTQSEAGVQQWGQLLFGYNAANERADIEFVRVRKPDGSVVNTSLDAVQDLSAPVQRVAPIYTDFRQKHATVESLRPGDTLEFKMVGTIHTALAPGHFWIEHGFTEDAIVLDELLEIDVPAEKPLTLKTRSGYEPAIKEDAGRRLYRWTHANLTRKAEDDEKSENEDQTPPEDVERSPVRLTTFESWDQVGRWYAALEAPQRVPTDDIRKKAAELTRGIAFRHREARSAVYLRGHQFSIREPLARDGPLPAASRGRRAARAIRRLQGQTHAAREPDRRRRSARIGGAHQQPHDHRPRLPVAVAVRSRDHQGERRGRGRVGRHDE